MTVTVRSFCIAAVFALGTSLPARSKAASASTSRTRGFLGSSFTASSMREPMRPPVNGIELISRPASVQAVPSA